jgi:hypothetical protein
MQEALHEHAQLHSASLRQFFEDDLGRLPLSVSLCANMMRADETLDSVDDLIGRFRSIDLADVDAQGHNPQVPSRQYLGLVRSVLLAVERLRQSAADSAEDKKLAMDLLAVLPSDTPVGLFRGEAAEDNEQRQDEGNNSALDRLLPAGTRVLVQRLVAKPEYNGKRARVLSFDARKGRYRVALDEGQELSLKPECVARLGCDRMFGAACKGFERARQVLKPHGLLRGAADETAHVGSVHKLVRLCTRQRLHGTVLFDDHAEAAAVLGRLVGRLDRLTGEWKQRFDVREYTRADDEVVPCVRQVLEHADALGPTALGLDKQCEFQQRLGAAEYTRTCNFKQAAVHWQEAVEIARRVHGD